jgi:gluconokinase
MIFDSGARPMEGYGARLQVNVKTTPGGGAEVDADELVELALDCLDETHRQAQASRLRIAAVAGSAFWHGLMGTGADGRPTTPLIHLFDTRSASYTQRVPDASARTGCPRHASYWPSKLLWLAEAHPEQFAATQRWMSFPEYLFSRLFGHARASTSMASATGLWSQRAHDYDEEMLVVTGVRREQLATPADMDLFERDLVPEFRREWPGFGGTAWFPLLGDGAADNLGSGCLNAKTFSLMVGTTGAMRAVVEDAPQSIAPGLWCYRVDRKRYLIGGALSNGGEVYAWMKRTLALPRDIEAKLDTAKPGSHGLVVLPFFSGERTPYWRGDLRASLTGLTLSTEPIDILRASMEAVALGFRQVYELLSATLGTPEQVIASGGGIENSRAWTQMMADALGRNIISSTEHEATSRGAALWALEQLGIIADVRAAPASTGAELAPRPEHESSFARMMGERHALYARLFGSGT